MVVSSVTTPSVASSMSSTTWAMRMWRRAMTTLIFSAMSRVLPLRRMPAVSMKIYSVPWCITAWSTESRVVPAMGETMARSVPTSALSSVDLPTFGRPMIATLMPAGPGGHQGGDHRPPERGQIDPAQRARRHGAGHRFAHRRNYARFGGPSRDAPGHGVYLHRHGGHPPQGQDTRHGGEDERRHGAPPHPHGACGAAHAGRYRRRGDARHHHRRLRP